MKRVKISEMKLNSFSYHIVDVTAIENEELKQYASVCHQLFTSQEIKKYIKQKFGEFVYYYYDDDTSDLTPEQLFTDDFLHYIKQMSVNTCMLYQGFSKNYDITENYFLSEKGYTGNKSGNISNNSDYLGKTNVTSKTYEATINATTKEVARNETELVPAHSETSINHDKSVTFNGENTESFATVTKLENEKHGNIGVQTPAEMLLKEYDIRFKKVLYDVVDDIMTTLTICIDTGD